MSAANCPVGSLAFWPYTTAVPSGWASADAGAFVGRYLQGDDPATYAAPANGGEASHNHTWADHNHVGDAHSHSITSSAHTTTTTLTGAVDASAVEFVKETKTVKHTHNDVTPGSTFVYGNSTASSAAGTAHPPYVKCVVIEPDDADQDVPNAALVLTDAGSAPAGFDLADGNGGRPNLDGKFILGCAAGVGNGGGDLGGDATHTHTMTHGALHAVTTPDHAAMSPSTGLNTVKDHTGAPAVWCLSDQHHDVPAMTHGAQTISAADNLTSDAVSNDPLHIELLGIINTSGVASTPVGTILGYYGVVADLPSNWQACDGTGGTPDCTDRHVKIVTSSPGTLAGSNEHDHDWSHGHTHTSGHNHSVSAVSVTYNGNQNKVTSTVSAIKVMDPLSHLHVSWSVPSTTPTMQDADFASSSDDIRNLYRTCIWIKKIGPGSRVIQPGPVLRTDRKILCRG